MTPDELRTICREHGILVSLAGLLRERDVARLLAVDVRTLQRWRDDGTGPDAVTIGRTWFYSVDAVASSLTPSDKQRHSTTYDDIQHMDELAGFPHAQAFIRRT